MSFFMKRFTGVEGMEEIRRNDGRLREDRLDACNLKAPTENCALEDKSKMFSGIGIGRE